MAVCVVGNYAYVASGSAGLSILNISTPRAPYLVGTCSLPAYATDVIAYDNTNVYVASGNGGMFIIDVTTPSFATVLGGWSTTGISSGIGIYYDHAILANFSSGLFSVDISNPSVPVGAGFCQLPGGLSLGVYIGYNTAFAADGVMGLKMSVFNNLGQEVGILFEGTLAAEEHGQLWNAGSVNSGVYNII